MNQPVQKNTLYYSNGGGNLNLGGLAEEVNESILHAAFIPFGDVKDVKTPLDQATQKHRSFGFVTFLEKEDASAAMDNMDGAELYGRVLTVNYALPERIKGGEQGWAAQPKKQDRGSEFETRFVVLISKLGIGGHSKWPFFPSSSVVQLHDPLSHKRWGLMAISRKKVKESLVQELSGEEGIVVEKKTSRTSRRSPARSRKKVIEDSPEDDFVSMMRKSISPQHQVKIQRKPEEELEGKAKMFYFNTFSMLDRNMRSTMLRAIKISKKLGGIIFYDLNLPLPLWQSCEETKMFIQEVWNLADVIEVTKQELEFLCGIKPSENFDTRDNDRSKFIHYTPEVFGQLWHENLKVLFVTNGTSKIHYYTKEHNSAVLGMEDAPITPFTGDMSASGDGIVAALMRMLTVQPHLITDKGYLEQSVKYAVNCGVIDQWRLARTVGFPPKEGMEENVEPDPNGIRSITEREYRTLQPEPVS
ncbi:hypothetical protein HYC85_015679 [Camellia sinensis]|uniref:RRM domain-containing protein n=1 Tax=Camellia sinensis TaxID=4442 RepID=A0A7J7GZP3_CAMSI|nr:hypothetical protein HYC85_015679 [Camellia sinensis]